MIMKNSISVAIRGAIPDSENAKEFLKSVEEQFKGSSKANASTLILKMLTTKYDGLSGVREHIMMMNDMASKLKGMDMKISEGFLVHFIMTSLLAQFGPFKINYNTKKEKWKMSELIAMCVQEEERLKIEKPDTAYLTTTKLILKRGKGLQLCQVLLCGLWPALDERMNKNKAFHEIITRKSIQEGLPSDGFLLFNGNNRSATRKLNVENTIEIGYEFLKILQDNAFNGIDGTDIVNHIAKVLEISEWIKIPNIDKDQLRLHVFPISLRGRAREWWDNEIKGTVTTWKELGKKFFHKYYSLSHTCHSKIPDDLDNGTYYLEFLEWLGSKFKNHWNMDENTKNGLWNFYVNEYNTEGLISNTEPSKDECDEPYKKSPRKSCFDSFFKPYLDAQEGNGIYNFEEAISISLKYQFLLKSTLGTQMNYANLKNSRSSDTRQGLMKNSSPSVHGTIMLGEKLMESYLASTMTYSTRCFADGS
ncbi:hypothetical protein Tco_0245313 [Tanacetum coccineum]